MVADKITGRKRGRGTEPVTLVVQQFDKEGLVFGDSRKQGKWLGMSSGYKVYAHGDYV